MIYNVHVLYFFAFNGRSIKILIVTDCNLKCDLCCCSNFHLLLQSWLVVVDDGVAGNALVSCQTWPLFC